ncbi:hypothetical protein AGLY_001810 [Aphis glycines]|uniref:Uncharacterized protein n=1 Tax=Aphis glycines TaxID=307491 RepID=A0A6G0U4S1_APHGL|nr:hypothetical protein AGLY_001810 [Aphis glycines]
MIPIIGFIFNTPIIYNSNPHRNSFLTKLRDFSKLKLLINFYKFSVERNISFIPEHPPMLNIDVFSIPQKSKGYQYIYQFVQNLKLIITCLPVDKALSTRIKKINTLYEYLSFVLVITHPYLQLKLTEYLKYVVNALLIGYLTIYPNGFDELSNTEYKRVYVKRVDTVESPHLPVFTPSLNQYGGIFSQIKYLSRLYECRYSIEIFIVVPINHTILTSSLYSIQVLICPSSYRFLPNEFRVTMLKL